MVTCDRASPARISTYNGRQRLNKTCVRPDLRMGWELERDHQRGLMPRFQSLTLRAYGAEGYFYAW